MKYRSVIVEDEELSRKRMRRLLAAFPEDIEVVGEADNGIQAVEIIRGLNPDLLFLDINLPGLDGFQLLGNLDRQPAVIFTTASDQHALEAFKTYAVDYLLKPIDQDALRKSVEKLRTMGFNPTSFSRAMEGMREHMGARHLSLIMCKVGDRLVLVKTADIRCFQSDNKYTSVFSDGKQYLIDATLTGLEGKLNPKDFIRIHRSTIVNVWAISEIRKFEGGKLKVVLSDKRVPELPIGDTYAPGLMALLGGAEPGMGL